MKKILISLSVIGAVAAIAVGGTIAYFSDTETSTGNTFSAGTIDIAIDTENPWTSNYKIGDLKPGETGYINFDIQNVGQNPVNVSKNLSNWNENTGSKSYICPSKDNYEGGSVSSEPECTEAQANSEDLNNVQSQIEYDLYVEVYNASQTKIWWQQIFNPDELKSLTDVYGDNGTQYVALGMIPVGGHMLVKQSYHFSSQAGNEYQGDKLSFDMTIKGEQLPQGDNGTASVVLENKRIGEPQWDIIQGDGIEGTLTYKTQGSMFEYAFNGKALLTGHNYVLAVGYNAATDVDKQIGVGVTDGDGNITISGSVVTGSLTNAKAWLIPAENWTGTAMNWTGWPGIVPNFLWETGLINYTQN